MTNQINDLMLLIDDYAAHVVNFMNFKSEENHAAVTGAEANLRNALEAALKPGVSIDSTRRAFCRASYPCKDWCGNTACLSKSAPPAQTCHCKDRPASECPGAWEPGCDLGNNAAHAKPYPPPRLTEKELDIALMSVPQTFDNNKYFRAIESAVRAQFGVQE